MHRHKAKNRVVFLSSHERRCFGGTWVSLWEFTPWFNFKAHSLYHQCLSWATRTIWECRQQALMLSWSSTIVFSGDRALGLRKRHLKSHKLTFYYKIRVWSIHSDWTEPGSEVLDQSANCGGLKWRLDCFDLSLPCDTWSLLHIIKSYFQAYRRILHLICCYCNMENVQLWSFKLTIVSVGPITESHSLSACLKISPHIFASPNFPSLSLQPTHGINKCVVFI